MNEKDKDVILHHLLSDYINEEDKEGFNEESKLITSGLIDSISILKLVDYLEEQFGIEFEPHEVDQENLNSVTKIIEFISMKRS